MLVRLDSGIGAGKRWSFILFTGGAIVFALWMFIAGTRPRGASAEEDRRMAEELLANTVIEGYDVKVLP